MKKIISTLVLVSSLLACNRKKPETVNPVELKDEIVILSVSPDKELDVNTYTEFEVRIKYTLASKEQGEIVTTQVVISNQELI